jgi:hypothetical protein
MKRDLDFWIEQTAPVRALPTDFSNGPNTEDSASTVDGELTAEETSALLASAPASLKATAEELLLLSVATAVSEWIGESAVLLNVESNGREDATGDLDLTSTVGWFTALYPLRLDVPQTASAEERLSGLKPQMRARPESRRQLWSAALPGEVAGTTNCVRRDQHQFSRPVRFYISR